MLFTDNYVIVSERFFLQYLITILTDLKFFTFKFHTIRFYFQFYSKKYKNIFYFASVVLVVHCRLSVKRMYLLHFKKEVFTYLQSVSNLKIIFLHSIEIINYLQLNYLQNGSVKRTSLKITCRFQMMDTCVMCLKRLTRRFSK